MKNKYDNYPIFEQWYKTYIWISQNCEKMPKNVRFTFTVRILNTSMNIMELVIQAINSADKQQQLLRINALLDHLRIYYRIAKDLHYISVEQYNYAAIEFNSTGKMAGGWLKSLKT